MNPNPALTRRIDPNHSIEVGISSWSESETSIRSRYDGQTGRFSPHGSSEIPIPDLRLIMEVAALNDLPSVADCGAIIEALTASIQRRT